MREKRCRDGSTHFWRKFSSWCTSVSTRLEEESVSSKGSADAEGISSIPVSPVSSPDDNRQAPPTRELSSFAMHNNLPPYIHIHKWRMHIRDKFPRGVPRLYAPKCKLFSGQIESWRGWQLRVGSRVYGGGEGRVVDRKDWYCRFQILDTPDT